MSTDEERRTRYISAFEDILATVDLPPSIRAEYRKAIEWLREYRDRPESRPDLEWARDNKFAAYLRDPELIRRLRDTGVVVEDGQGTVSVRWDLVRTEDRAAAYSFLNALVDGYRKRSAGGRPRK